MSIKNNILSHIIQFLSLLILITTIYFVIFPSITKLQETIIIHKYKIINDIEQDLGLTIKYGSMSPLIVDSMVLKDVSIISNNLEHSVFISNVTIKFSFINIIRSRWHKIEPLEIISSINLRGGEIKINYEDEWLISKFKSTELSNSAIKTKVYLKDIDVSINYDNLIINVEDAKGSIQTRNKRYYTKLKAKVTYITKLDFKFKYFTADADITGFLENNIVNLETRVKLKNCSSDIGKIKDLDADLSIIDLELNIVNRDKKSNFDYIYKYKINKYEMFFNVDALDFYVKDLIVPDNNVLDLTKVLSSKFSGNVKGSYNLENRSFFYSSKGKLLLKDFYEPFPINTNFNLNGNNDSIKFRNLNIYTPKGYVGFNGDLDLKNYFPNGSLYLRDIDVANNIKVDSNIKIKVINDRFINANFDYIESSDITFTNISSLFYIDDKEISFQGIKKDTEGQISLSGKFNRKDKSISSLVNISDLNLKFLENFEQLDFIQSYLTSNKLSVLASAEYINGNISYNIKDLELDDGQDNVLVKAKGFGSNTSFILDQLELNFLDINVNGRVDGNFNDLKTTLKVDTLINDNKYKFDINIMENVIAVEGSYGIDLNLILGDTKYINLSAKDLPLSYRDFNVTTSLELQSALFSDNSFILSIPEFKAKIKNDLFPYDPFISFSLDGSNKNIKIKNLILEDNISPLLGDLDINFEENGYISILSNLSDGESESYYIKSLVSNDLKTINLDLKIKDMLLDRFHIDNLKGNTDLSLDFTGGLDGFSGSGKLKSEEFFYNLNSIGLDMDFKLTKDLISVTNFEGFYNRNIIKLPLLTYNYKNGDIVGKIDSIINVGNIELNSDLAIDLSVKPIDNILKLNTNLLYNINGKITILNFNKDDEVLFKNKIFRIFNNTSALQVYSLDKNLKMLYSHKTGLTNLRISKPYFSELTMTGIIKDGELNLSLKDINIDALFAKSFISPQVDISTLSVLGQLNISGTTTNPKMNGLLWADTQFDVSYIPEIIDPSRLNLRVVDNLFTILPGSINIGESGKLKLSGEMLLDSWSPENILINMSILKENKIPFKYQNGRIISEVNIYAPEVIFYWDNSGSLISGDIIVEDGEFYTQIINVTEVTPNDVKKERSSFEVNINTIMGANNKLYWPTKELPIVYATLSPGDNVNVDYKSVTGDFNINGKISIINGEVDYSGNPFILKEGEVVLDLTNDQIDPYINLLATKTVLYTNDDDVKKLVDVSLSFKGGFFSDFKPTFTTNDSTISEDEISSLVGLAVTGESYSALISDVLGDGVTSYLTSSVEQSLEEIIGVDDVQIESGFFSSLFNTWVEDLNITNVSLGDDDETGYNLSEMINDTSLSIGNFVTDDFFYDFAVGTNYENEEIGLSVNFGITLFTPHFQLGFSMEPKLSDSYVFEPEIGLSIAWIYNPEEDE